MKKKIKIIFICWIAFSRRSQLIAEKFNAKLFQVQYLKHIYLLSPVRYILQAAKTIKILFCEKPELIFVQNPPIFAPLVIFIYSKLFNAKYIIDSHTGALLAPWWKWSLSLHAFLSRRALTTIVTNKFLEDKIKLWRSDSFIISDIPTKFPKGKEYQLDSIFNIAVINTFAPDEPIEEILKAASKLPDIHFYITGDIIRAKKAYLKNHPENIVFTNFLPDDQYIGLLQAVQAILVLTYDNHTMQRGACEAVSLGKPIITSNWPILKDYFHKGTIFVDNNSQRIKEGIIECKRRRRSLEKEILLLRKERWQEWYKKFEDLNNIIKNFI